MFLLDSTTREAGSCCISPMDFSRRPDLRQCAPCPSIVVAPPSSKGEMKKIHCIVGTRPEAIKMAPIILALRRELWANVCVLATAQHREMLDKVLGLFRIEADYDLDIMRANQTLPEVTAQVLLRLDDIFTAERPDAVLAQGDTTTVMAAALACFYRHIPFGHVEGGLRTGNIHSPFPEEMNRIVASRLAWWHFAPTAKSRLNLLHERIPEAQVHVTGNTVIDALLQIAQLDVPIGIELDASKKLVLVTAHRRENFGNAFLQICRAIRVLADGNEDIEILYPVHPNPNVREPALRELSNHPRIRLAEPLDYGPFVSAMKRAFLILTDSGGVQEEAPALGKPVLVLRNETERPEALDAGLVRLVGPDCDAILNNAQELLRNTDAYTRMSKGASPYGDGRAAERIVNILRQHFEGVSPGLSGSDSLAEFHPAAT